MACRGCICTCACMSRCVYFFHTVYFHNLHPLPILQGSGAGLWVRDLALGKISLSSPSGKRMPPFLCAPSVVPQQPLQRVGVAPGPLFPGLMLMAVTGWLAAQGKPCPSGHLPRPPGPSKATLDELQMTHTVFKRKKIKIKKWLLTKWGKWMWGRRRRRLATP